MVIAAGNELLNPTHLLTEILKVGAGSHLADFGCGATAINTLTAAKLVGDRGQVYAVDILKSVLSSVESHKQHEGLVNIKTVWADLERAGSTKLASESLDFVLLINLLFQAKDPLVVLAEARRLLKFGGQALIVDWQSRPEGIGPADGRRISESQMQELLTKAEFTITQTFIAGPHHYGFVVTK